MNELEEDIIREHMYEEHRARMEVVRKNMNGARIYNVYFNLLVTFVSVFGLYLWFCYTNAGIKLALTLAEEVGQISFPWYAVTFFLTPPVAVMSYLADIYLVKKLNIACQIIYLVMLLFSVSNLFIRFEPMTFWGMILLIVYSGLGLWTQDLAVRSYKELDHLRTQEGFPDFNYGIERDRHSRFVKYREKWLKDQKKQDYYSDREKPVSEFAVVPAEKSDRMDGISVDTDVCSDWFEGKDEAPAEENKAASDMEQLEADPSLLPDSSEYIIDDIRHKPL
ncbi:MAG: hypothetical protein ACI4J0_06825 [Huintestinicola sp.]|uniref:hypothetical protein n=1 Tax=Huintestinicola sp. TaxID=2981661 RepID=UPI003F0AD7CA